MEIFLYVLYLALCRYFGGIVPSKILTILLLKNYKDDSPFGMKKGGRTAELYALKARRDTSATPQDFPCSLSMLYSIFKGFL